MDLFGFDDLVELPRDLPQDREWCDHRLFRAVDEAPRAFQVIPEIESRAFKLIHQWKRAGVAHVNLHLLVGLAYMHAASEYRGGSVVFPIEVLQFFSSSKTHPAKYGDVLAAYRRICSRSNTPQLPLHVESAIRRILASGTAIKDTTVFEAVVSRALEVYDSVERNLQKHARKPTIECLLGACVTIALRKLDVRQYSRSTVASACLQPPKSNVIDLWVRKLADNETPSGNKRRPKIGIAVALKANKGEELVSAAEFGNQDHFLPPAAIETSPVRSTDTPAVHYPTTSIRLNTQKPITKPRVIETAEDLLELLGE